MSLKNPQIVIRQSTRGRFSSDRGMISNLFSHGSLPLLILTPRYESIWPMVSPFVLEALGISAREIQPYKTAAIEVIERNAPRRKKDEGKTSNKISDDEILTLSYFQIDDYLTCPLKYKYIHILRVPIIQHHAVIYGKALHDAIQYYYQCKLQGKELSVDELILIFERSWLNEGFISKEHELRRLEEGKRTLENFYARVENEKVLPTYIEKEFNFLLGKNRITGRWDRVDIVNGKVYIIDYKSSDIKDKKKADKRAKESLQLAIYALAYQMIYGKIPDSVRLHFLETGVIGEATLGEKELSRTIDKIEEASRGIRSGFFEPQPKYLSCRFCPYLNICPHQGKRKYLG